MEGDIRVAFSTGSDETTMAISSNCLSKTSQTPHLLKAPLTPTQRWRNTFQGEEREGLFLSTTFSFLCPCCILLSYTEGMEWGGLLLQTEVDFDTRPQFGHTTWCAKHFFSEVLFLGSHALQLHPWILFGSSYFQGHLLLLCLGR